MSDKEILTVAEAAKLLGIHPQTLYERCAMGDVPHKRLGRRLLFSRRKLVEWVEGVAA